MQTRSKILFPFLVAGALAGLHQLVGGNCLDGQCLISGVYAAQVSRGPVAPKRDPELEKEALHNLDVAWQYFNRKLDKSDPNAVTRSNNAILSRLNEVLDTNPVFSKIDEVYFLLGEVHLRGNEPDEAIKWFTAVAEKYPDSKYNKDAKKRLATLTETSGKKAVNKIEDKAEDKKEGKKKS